jgi:hypothetical protein
MASGDDKSSPLPPSSHPKLKRTSCRLNRGCDLVIGSPDKLPTGVKQVIDGIREKLM